MFKSYYTRSFFLVLIFFHLFRELNLMFVAWKKKQQKRKTEWKGNKLELFRVLFLRCFNISKLTYEEMKKYGNPSIKKNVIIFVRLYIWEQGTNQPVSHPSESHLVSLRAIQQNKKKGNMYQSIIFIFYFVCFCSYKLIPIFGFC